jgi:regulator of replication initiation timing
MKKTIFIFLFILLTSIFVFADPLSDANNALAETNTLLQEALSRIQVLEAENAALTSENTALKTTLEEANRTLSENNALLQQLSDRIDADQIEIDNLRKNIQQLISTGVEVVNYDLGFSLFYGYPNSAQFLVNWNFPFFPALGIEAGFNYNFAINQPVFLVGIKLNIRTMR